MLLMQTLHMLLALDGRTSQLCHTGVCCRFAENFAQAPSVLIGMQSHPIVYLQC